MVATHGVAECRPNQFYKCAIVGLRTTYYIVMCDINMTTFDKGGVNSAWLGGVEF